MGQPILQICYRPTLQTVFLVVHDAVIKALNRELLVVERAAQRWRKDGEGAWGLLVPHCLTDNRGGSGVSNRDPAAMAPEPAGHGWEHHDGEFRCGGSSGSERCDEAPPAVEGG
jgi:hypothetical protein